MQTRPHAFTHGLSGLVVYLVEPCRKASGFRVQGFGFGVSIPRIRTCPLGTSSRSRSVSVSLYRSVYPPSLSGLSLTQTHAPSFSLHPPSSLPFSISSWTSVPLSAFSLRDRERAFERRLFDFCTERLVYLQQENNLYSCQHSIHQSHNTRLPSTGSRLPRL